MQRCTYIGYCPSPLSAFSPKCSIPPFFESEIHKYKNTLFIYIQMQLIYTLYVHVLEWVQDIKHKYSTLQKNRCSCTKEWIAKWELNLQRLEMKPNSHMVLSSFYQLPTNPQQLQKSQRKALSHSLEIAMKTSLKMFQYFYSNIHQRRPYTSIVFSAYFCVI